MREALSAGCSGLGGWGGSAWGRPERRAWRREEEGTAGKGWGRATRVEGQLGDGEQCRGALQCGNTGSQRLVQGEGDWNLPHREVMRVPRIPLSSSCFLHRSETVFPWELTNCTFVRKTELAFSPA